MGPRLVWVLVSAGLLVAALPPHSWGPLGWLALVPLVLSTRAVTPRIAAAQGAIFGVTATAAMHAWLWHLSAFGVADALAVGAYLAVYPAAWCAVLAWSRARRLPWVLIGAFAWTLLHVLRGRAGFLADPWDPLAYTQIHEATIVRLASLGGEPLVGFVVCLVNLALAHAWQMRDARRLLAPGAVVVAACAYGLTDPGVASHGDELTVAVIQPGDAGPSAEARLEALRALTLDVATEHPDLVVWPESAVSGYFFDPAVQAAVGAIAIDANAPILLGSADFGKYAQEAPTSAEDLQLKNQAFLVGRDGALRATYAKNRLVPFAEWTPLSAWITWPRWLVARQLHGIAGDAPGLVQLEDGQRVGVLICWENLFTDLAGRLDRGGASMIVQLTNDSDFEGAAEPAQHNAASIMRAVEYGQPLLVASTTGPSLAIDARGHVQTALGQSALPARMLVHVNTARTTTVYSWLGLNWLWLPGIVAGLMSGRAIRAGRLQR